MPAISTGLAIGLAATAAAGGVASSAIGAHAAGKAAKAGSTAAMTAAQLQHDSEDKALAFQKQVYGDTQGRESPFLEGGYSGLANLESLLGMPVQGNEQVWDPKTQSYSGKTSLSSLVNPQLGAPGSLMKPWDTPFVAPTDVTEQNDPGYKFRLSQGIGALQNSAAAKGTLLNGGTAAGINAYGQDYASNEYNNVYNRSLEQYQQAYNIFENNQNNTFNRLASLVGGGQTTAAQLNSEGQSAASNVGSILYNGASAQGQDIKDAGSATASGYVGGANAWGSGLANLSNLGQLAMLSKMYGSKSSGLTSISPFGQVPLYG